MKMLKSTIAQKKKFGLSRGSSSKFFITTLMVFQFCTLVLQAQSDAIAYKIFDKEGKEVSWEHLLASSMDQDVIFFGELHNHALVHWLQLRLLKALAVDQERALTLGMEMFEKDDQAKINEYFSGFIKGNHFENEAKLWNNYTTDYKPLVEFARRNEIALLATNVPRRYAAAVAFNGLAVLDDLHEGSFQWIAPLPLDVNFNLSTYQEMKEMMGGHGGADKAENMVAAQALKDATMAHSLAESWKENTRILHLNGSYHSRKKEGILSYLNTYRPGLSTLTIQCLEVDRMEMPERKLLEEADYSILVPEDFIKSY